MELIYFLTNAEKSHKKLFLTVQKIRMSIAQVYLQCKYSMHMFLHLGIETAAGFGPVAFQAFTIDLLLESHAIACTCVTLH